MGFYTLLLLFLLSGVHTLHCILLLVIFIVVVFCFLACFLLVLTFLYAPQANWLHFSMIHILLGHFIQCSCSPLLSALLLLSIVCFTHIISSTIVCMCVCLVSLFKWFLLPFFFACFYHHIVFAFVYTFFFSLIRILCFFHYVYQMFAFYVLASSWYNKGFTVSVLMINQNSTLPATDAFNVSTKFMLL